MIHREGYKVLISGSRYRVSQKTGCCWSDRAQLLDHPLLMAISTGLGRPRLWKLFFWSFFSSCTKTRQDQALPSHAYGKFLPHITKFWLGFLGSSSILILIFFLVGRDVLYVQMPCLCFKSLCFTAKNCMRQTNSKSGSQPKTT